jgi:hypothetical protein
VPVVVFAAADVDPADRRRAAAVLVKSRTTNEQLISTLKRVLESEYSPMAMEA